MSFGGSVQGMISSLKSNALPKRRHSILSKEKELTASGVSGELKFIEVSETELLKIKQQIKKDAIRQRIINLIIILPFIVLMIFVLISIV